MKIQVTALHNDTLFDLQLKLLAGESGLTREINHPRVQKPGLALTGHCGSLRPGRVQVLGRTECDYLAQLERTPREQALKGLMGAGVACVVATGDRSPDDHLLALAGQHEIPLFSTALSSGMFIRRVHDLLEEHLAPETTVHGVFVDVSGVGVLLSGPSGIGKSECALDLILRGHRLIADDVALIYRHNSRLIGLGSPLTRHHMEVRGLGIINVRDLFGAAAVCERKPVDLVIQMSEWREGAGGDRTGIDDSRVSILEVEVPLVRVPLRSGRNVASIVEVAARNHLLKAQGDHTARKFQQALELKLSETALGERFGRDEEG